MKSENIMKAIDGKKISLEDCKKIFYDALENPEELFLASQQLRKKFKGNAVTFSKKAFFNLTNLCRDSCSYCTYKAEPSDSKVSMMSKNRNNFV